MKTNKSWLAVFAVVAALASAQTARAITFGEPDKGRHPNVGAVMVKAPYAEPFQYMSGILIGSKLFLAAGHGTSEIEFGIKSGWFSLSYLYVTFADDPYDESFWLPIVDVRTHPGYKPAKYDLVGDVWADAHGMGAIPIEDMGLLVLAEVPTGIVPAALPPLGLLDELKRNGQLGPDTKILAVGYGSHATFRPSTVVYEPHNRELVFSEYRGFNHTCLTLSMNQVLENGGGGYGDSGGPRFWINPVDGSEHLVSITERGGPNLVSLDVTYRIDTSAALDFIQAVTDELNEPPVAQP